MSKAVVQLPIRLIDQGPNVRRRLHVGSPLVASVKRFGVLQPITVAQRGSRYEVLYGHRRLAAASLAGDETIAAIVEERPAGLGIRQLVENLDRRNLPHIDVALALRSALDDEPGLSQAALARQLGRHPTWVTNKLALLKLDRSTQDDIRNGTTRADAALKARPSLGDGRSAPRTEITRAVEEGRSASVVIPILKFAAPNRGGAAQLTIGVDRAEGTVDLVVEVGSGRSVVLTISPEEARLIGRRFMQAFQAVAS